MMSEYAPEPTTGLAGLDAVLRGVQPGDNIVWQVQRLDEYLALVAPYAEAARRQGRRLIYFSFASHPPLLAVESGAEIHRPRPAYGFDTFVDEVHGVIEAAGPGALYVFDCLSDLAEVWQSDRMMANFFSLTCPRLLDLKTVTYFGLYRNRHAQGAIDTIARTTQFLLDVFRCRGRIYLRPVKVQHRSAAATNLIHAWEGERFRPVVDSATLSEVLAGADWPGLENQAQPGQWQRYFTAARALAAERRAGRPDPTAETAWFDRLGRLVFSDDPATWRLVHRYLGLDDLLAVRDRMIGIGEIGGKALGMLLARAILRQDAPDLFSRIETQDAFFVGTVVFDTFLIQNGVWWTRRRQRDPETFLQGLDEARERILGGQFPPSTLRQFEGMLDYFGEWPFVVRSSSRLEDRYGSAFAGQYPSVFCVNQGTREGRLAALLDAVRQVYASTLSEGALRYRERRGLLGRNEQMGLLIMRVSGTIGGRYFHPHASGVALSFNPYPWNPQIDPRAGVVRIVAGLGTRAVERVDDDHTRLIALNAPHLRPESDFGAIARYSQRRMDSLDLTDNRLVSGPFAELAGDQAGFPFERLISREEPGRPPFLTFEGLIGQTPFVDNMRRALGVLQAAYEHPVEIEFALNFLPGGGYRINLHRCRPLTVRISEGGVTAEPPAEARPLIASQGAVIGPSRAIQPQRLVYVVPAAYSRLGQTDRLAVTRIVGEVNRASPHLDLLLLGPGRWGSRDPSLGVPVAFAQIDRVAALGEIVAMHETLVPDVSLGTHFINELIETDILYFALFPQRPGNTIDEEALLQHPNRLTDLVEDGERWTEVVRVLDLAPGTLGLYADAERQRVTVTIAP